MSVRNIKLAITCQFKMLHFVDSYHDKVE